MRDHAGRDVEYAVWPVLGVGSVAFDAPREPRVTDKSWTHECTNGLGLGCCLDFNL